jgi:hypothetical protein
VNEERPSDPGANAPSLSADARQGRGAFFVIAGLYLAWELAILGLQAVNESPLVVQSVVRTITGAALFFFAWRGLRWAHVLLAVAFGIFAAAGWLTALAGEYAAIGWLIAAMGTCFGLAGLAMLFERRLVAYFRFQREHD